MPAEQQLNRNESDYAKTSASQYLSERGDKSSAEKRVFRLILRSEENNGTKLKAALEGDLAKIDVTTILDRQGHSPLSYAVYKEKAAAVRVLLEYIHGIEEGSKAVATNYCVLD